MVIRPLDNCTYCAWSPFTHLGLGESSTIVHDITSQPPDVSQNVFYWHFRQPPTCWLKFVREQPKVAYVKTCQSPATFEIDRTTFSFTFWIEYNTQCEIRFHIWQQLLQSSSSETQLMDSKGKHQILRWNYLINLPQYGSEETILLLH